MGRNEYSPGSNLSCHFKTITYMFSVWMTPCHTFLSFPLCVSDICACSCGWCAHMCACVWRWSPTSDAFLSLCLSFETDSHWTWDTFVWLQLLALHPHTCVIHVCHCAPLLCRCWNLNLGLCACVAATLPSSHFLSPNSISKNLYRCYSVNL